LAGVELGIGNAKVADGEAVGLLIGDEDVEAVGVGDATGVGEGVGVGGGGIMFSQ